MASVGPPGNWLLRATGATRGARCDCFGDGSGTACPCGNSGAAGHDCANTVHSVGAHLAATGNATVGADTLVLTGSFMPSLATSKARRGTPSRSVTA